MRASLDAIPEEHVKATELEAKLVRMRLMAIRIVTAEAEKKDANDDEPEDEEKKKLAEASNAEKPADKVAAKLAQDAEAKARSEEEKKAEDDSKKDGQEPGVEQKVGEQEKNGDGNGNAAEKVTEQASTGGLSHVGQLLKLHRTNPQLALKKYIASFSSVASHSEFGSSPPCREYRNLVHMSEWGENLTIILGCSTKVDLDELTNSMKGPKRALV